MTITPFLKKDDPQTIKLVGIIMKMKPIQNLTEEEVITAMKLWRLEYMLRKDETYPVTIYQNDRRLELLTDEDRFLAALLDTDCRDTLLTYKRLHYLFGGTEGFWRKIVKNSVAIDVRSKMVEGGHGGRYLGRGWVIAPNIRSLVNWISKAYETRTVNKEKNTAVS